MIKAQSMQANEIPDPRWKDLYRIGGIAYLGIGVMVVLAVVAYFIWPYKPGIASTEEVFDLLQTERMVGLISLDMPMFVLILFNIVGLLALYVALKQVNESYALIALVIGLVSATSVIPARPLVELTLLSDQYAAATSAAEQTRLLTAGETLLLSFSGTAWLVQTLLLGVSTMISSVLKLRSPFFRKITAYTGILAGALALGAILPSAAAFFLLANTLMGIAWCLLTASDLLRMAGGGRTSPAYSRSEAG
jgi:hypothetical protein